jgi:GcrA cell cycle regulator
MNFFKSRRLSPPKFKIHVYFERIRILQVGGISMSWTDERVALLKKLWGEGKSAAEIAKMLGGGLTRNAVIGKAHRLKLSNRISPIQQNNKKAVAPAAKAAEEKKTPPAIIAKTVKKSTGGVKMVNLKERQCRWPHGDPKDADFHLCGDEIVPGLPYCTDHAKMAYQVPSRSRILDPKEFERERPHTHDFGEDDLKEAASA